MLQARQDIPTSSDSVILIPARFKSQRFPGKMLAVIDGKPMIQRVYENCLGSRIPTFIVTDSDEIEQAAMKFQARVLRVDDDVLTGTERIYLAYKRYLDHNTHLQRIINVQGDEPLLSGEYVAKLADFHQTENFDLVTLLRPQKELNQDYLDENVVKAIYLESSRSCLYFSRSPIPFYRRTDLGTPWYQHVGVYSYRVQVLEQFCKTPPVLLEMGESLEQLRALSLGFSIGAITIDCELHGVDVLKDVSVVEGVLRGKK